jgi:hypothetical protein
MPEDAVLDTPEIDVDLGTDSADADHSADTDTSGDHSESDRGDENQNRDGDPQDQADRTGRLVSADGKLAPAAKALIDKLKTGTPEEQKTAKMLTRALFAEDRLRRELPGGFNELKGMRQQIDELGGFDGLKQRGQELEYFNALDQQFTAGDPKFLEALVGSKEGQQAFLKLAPAMLGKFAELNEEGHSAYMARAVVAHMQANRVPLDLERLRDFLPADNPAAKQLWEKLAGYFNGLNDLAQKPVAPAATARSGEGDNRNQELEQREQSLTRKEWSGEGKEQHSKIYQTAWSKAVGSRQLTDVQKENLGVFYQMELKRLLPRDFTEKLEQYFSTGQKDGYLRYRNTVLSESVPKALRAAIQRAGIAQKPGPKGAQQQQQQQRGGAPAKPDQGFTLVNQKPDFAKVDNRVTTPSMYSAGKFILKDGTKVQWKR